MIKFSDLHVGDILTDRANNTRPLIVLKKTKHKVYLYTIRGIYSKYEFRRDNWHISKGVLGSYKIDNGTELNRLTIIKVFSVVNFLELLRQAFKND